MKGTHLKGMEIYEPQVERTSCFFKGAVAMLADTPLFFLDIFEDSVGLSILNRKVFGKNMATTCIDSVLNTLKEICELSRTYSLLTSESLVGTESPFVRRRYFARTACGYRVVDLQDPDFRDANTAIIARAKDATLDELLDQRIAGQGEVENVLVIPLHIELLSGYPLLAPL
jgi:hypothetical protein